jgi:Leucine-rich repeat (LRR) protein
MKKIILIFAFLVSTLYASSLTTADKKVILKNCIMYKDGARLNTKKRIDYNTVTHIECKDKDIKKLPNGILKMKSLVYIDISGNKIKYIPNNLYKKKLDYLNIYNNELKDIPKKYKNIKTFIITKKDNKIFNNSELKNLTPAEVNKYNILLKKYKEITWYDLDYYGSHLNLDDKAAKLALKTLKVKKLLKLQSINPHKQSFLYKKYAKICKYKIKRYYDSAYARLDRNETQAFGKLLSDRNKFSTKRYNYYLQKYRNLSNSQLNYQLRTQKCIQDISVYRALTTLLK